MHGVRQTYNRLGRTCRRRASVQELSRAHKCLRICDLGQELGIRPCGCATRGRGGSPSSAPVPFCSTPLKVVLPLSLPTVNAEAVAPLFNTEPVPESEPIVLLNPCKSKMEFTVKSEFWLSALANPTWSVPALTVVPPESNLSYRSNCRLLYE